MKQIAKFLIREALFTVTILLLIASIKMSTFPNEECPYVPIVWLFSCVVITSTLCNSATTSCGSCSELISVQHRSTRTCGELGYRLAWLQTKHTCTLHQLISLYLVIILQRKGATNLLTIAIFRHGNSSMITGVSLN